MEQNSGGDVPCHVTARKIRKGWVGQAASAFDLDLRSSLWSGAGKVEMSEAIVAKR